MTVHQCLNGRAPPYMSEHCIPVSSADTRRHLRSANRHLLAVPRFRLNTYGRRAFSVAGPMTWNSLPGFILDPTSSTDCFGRLLCVKSHVQGSSENNPCHFNFCMMEGSSPLQSPFLTPLKCVTHGQGNARPTVAFPAAENHRPLIATNILFGDRGTCM